MNQLLSNSQTNHFSELTNFIVSSETRGINRSASHQQIEANNDEDAIRIWLARATGSKHTLRSYYKEIERFYFWVNKEKQKFFSDIVFEDILSYIEFIKNPPISWIGPRKPRNSNEWKPFEKPLSPRSCRYSIQVINSCFNFLVDAGYLIGNPCRLLQKKEISDSTAKAKIERYLEHNTWNLLVDYLEKLPSNNKREKNEKARLRFLFHLLYLQAPRVSEIAQACMNDFSKEKNSWWWLVRGKGKKVLKIPANKKMIDELISYRLHLGLEPLPLPQDNSPLIRSINGTNGLTDNMIYRIVKKTVKLAAYEIEKNDPYSAFQLKKASTHWFRHTSITHQADLGIDIRYLQATARHSSIETTQKYLHINDNSWHDAINKHKI